MLGNVLGGLSGPAIKPIALRIVYQVARAVKIPLVGIGGIATIDDVMEFLVDRRHGRADRHGELLQSHGLHANPRRPARRLGRTRRRVGGRSGGNAGKMK